MRLAKLRKLVEQSKVKIDDELLIDIHHEFMKAYGWISFDEFKKIKIAQMNALLERINKDKEMPDVIPVIVLGQAKRSYARKLLRGG